MGRRVKQLSGVFEKNPGSGIWYIRYRIDGKLVRKRIGSRSAAIEHLNKVKYIRVSGEGVVARSAKEYTRTRQELTGWIGDGPLVSHICEDYLAHITDPNNPRQPLDQVNPRQRIGAISDAFGHRSAGSLMPYEIEDWLRGLDRKPATLNRYKSTFSSIFRYAKGRGKVPSNPVRDTQQFRVQLPIPRWLSEEEETKIRAVLAKWIDTCPDHHRLTKLFLMGHPHELTVALGTGMRKGNQYALRWQDLNFEHRMINLPITKTGKPQSIPMIDDVYAAFIELKAIQDEISIAQEERSRETGHPPIKMVADGRVFNISENREWWSKALTEANISDLRWHDLRHTFATRLTRLTGNLKIVQEACGHASIAMTARYAHVDQSLLRNAMSGLNRSAI